MASRKSIQRPHKYIELEFIQSSPLSYKKYVDNQTYIDQIGYYFSQKIAFFEFHYIKKIKIYYFNSIGDLI